MRCKTRTADLRYIEIGWLHGVAVNTRDQGHVRQDYIRSEHHGRTGVHRGMRIPVSVIVGQIAHGAAWEEVLKGHPDLEREDIQQAIEYAARLTREEIRIG